MVCRTRWGTKKRSRLSGSHISFGAELFFVDLFELNTGLDIHEHIALQVEVQVVAYETALRPAVEIKYPASKLVPAGADDLCLLVRFRAESVEQELGIGIGTLGKPGVGPVVAAAAAHFDKPATGISGIINIKVVAEPAAAAVSNRVGIWVVKIRA